MSLLNKKNVKSTALSISSSTGRRFTRVSNEFIQHIENRLLEVIKSTIHSHPSKGVTLKKP